MAWWSDVANALGGVLLGGGICCLYLAWPYVAFLVVGGIIVGGYLIQAVVAVFGRTDRRRQGALIAELRSIGSRWPDEPCQQGPLIARDPITGELVSFERDRGQLMLVTAAPEQTDRPVIATRYRLGRYVPAAPPLLRHVGPVQHVAWLPSRFGWWRRFDLSLFNEATGILGVSADETAALVQQVRRSLAAGRHRLRPRWRL